MLDVQESRVFCVSQFDDYAAFVVSPCSTCEAASAEVASVVDGVDEAAVALLAARFVLAALRREFTSNHTSRGMAPTIKTVTNIVAESINATS